MSAKWIVTACVHAYPQADLIDHELSPSCPCGPTEERVEGDDAPRFVFTHHSLDGREQPLTS